METELGYVDFDPNDYDDREALTKINPAGVKQYLREGRDLKYIAQAYGVGIGSMQMFIRQNVEEVAR